MPPVLTPFAGERMESLEQADLQVDRSFSSAASVTTTKQQADSDGAAFVDFLLSQPNEYALHGIQSFDAQVSRKEWLYRPPQGIPAQVAFRRMETEESGWRLEERIIRDALKWVAKSDQSISINISPTALGVPEFSARLIHLIETTRVDLSRIWWEVTELWPLPKPQPVISTLRAAREAGAIIAIDDITDEDRLACWLDLFGVPNIVKIDRSVIKDDSDRKLHQLVEKIHGRGAEVVVEGIETPEQKQRAELTGARYWQGYLGGWPVRVGGPR